MRTPTPSELPGSPTDHFLSPSRSYRRCLTSREPRCFSRVKEPHRRRGRSSTWTRKRRGATTNIILQLCSSRTGSEATTARIWRIPSTAIPTMAASTARSSEERLEGLLHNGYGYGRCQLRIIPSRKGGAVFFEQT